MEGNDNRLTQAGYAHFSSWTNMTNINTILNQDFGTPDVEMHPNQGVYAPVNQELWSDADYALGSHFIGDLGTFAVYAGNADAILLEIYENHALEDAVYAYWMEKGTDGIWRAKIDLTDVDYVFYGFRAWGSNWQLHEDWNRGNSSKGFISDYDPIYGHRYNPNKVLFDPYGLEITHDKESIYLHLYDENGGMFGTGGVDTNLSHVYAGELTTGGLTINRRNVDTAYFVPKSILFKSIDIETHTLTIPPQDLITMETHVRGFTMHHSASRLEDILDGIPGFEEVVNIPEAYRGTYKGAAMMAPYLKALGYNAIEFLPVHETDNDANELYLLDNMLKNQHPKPNFWGYMTLSYFAPDRRYAYDQSWGGPTREFKEMVNAFNEAGIAVFIDVVYNHSGEGGNWGDKNVTGFTSLGGFDTSAYYTLSYDDVGWVEQGATGVGNQINFGRGQDAAMNLVKDSLIYWTEVMGVDGYRFDLASTLGRDPWHFNPEHELLTWIGQYGIEQGVKMVAEPWDIWGVTLTGFPEGWGAWNNNYRDSVRAFLKGDANTHAFTSVVNGDWYQFGPFGKSPYHSINFLVAHDGLTLADLVSYTINDDHTRDYFNTQPWPFGPSDGGSGNNTAWDSSGFEGVYNISVHDLRRQRLRNLWVIQFFSRGIPMSVYGDEFGRTQNGNNNPYNVDSIATWNNYDMIRTDSPHLVQIDPIYCNGVMTNCQYHNNLGTDSNPDGINNIFLFSRNVIHLRKNHESLRRTSYDLDYQFTKANGESLSHDDRAVMLRIRSHDDTDFILLINMWEDNVDFTIPEAEVGHQWIRRIDTAHWAEQEFNNYWSSFNAESISNYYGVNPWSIVVLKEVPR